MPQPIRLEATHPTILSLVGKWLEESRLELSATVRLQIDVVDSINELPSGEPVFRQARVALYRDQDQPNGLRVEWQPALGRAVFETNAASITVARQALDRPNELLRSFLLNVVILLLRRAGLHHVHGATLLDPEGRGWFLVGVSGSGKSTTSVLLAKLGWSIGTDDIAFLTAGAPPRHDAVDVVAWRERLALRDDAVAAAGHAAGTALSTRRKTGWYPEELGTRWVGKITPSILAFPTVGPGPTTATLMRPAEALKRIMPCSPWVALEPDLADEHLGLMTALVTRTRAFAVNLGRDLFDHPQQLPSLVA